jgi:excisionase family DNA binding protein
MAKKNDKPEVFSALEVANICGVVNQTAINWIKGGHLKAFTTPGGQYRVYPDDLAEFMKNRDMRIPAELEEKCSASVLAKKSILIVDDDRGLNTVIARFLGKKFKDSTVEIYQAFDGFEAGVLMTEKHPGVLILDLDLPGVDGFSLCKRIRGDSSFGKPVIAVVTALEDNSVEARVKELGVDYFFKKPLNLLEIAEAVF